MYIIYYVYILTIVCTKQIAKDFRELRFKFFRVVTKVWKRKKQFLSQWMVH